MRDRRLQSIEAIVERQQSMPAEGDDHRLLLDRQHGRSRLAWTGLEIRRRAPSLPLGHRLLVDAVALRQSPQALLTMLYRSTNRLCRRGAPMVNLAHSASFHSREKTAPSKPGIKQLAASASNPCRSSPS